MNLLHCTLDELIKIEKRKRQREYKQLFPPPKTKKITHKLTNSTETIQTQRFNFSKKKLKSLLFGYIRKHSNKFICIDVVNKIFRYYYSIMIWNIELNDQQSNCLCVQSPQYDLISGMKYEIQLQSSHFHSSMELYIQLNKIPSGIKSFQIRFIFLFKEINYEIRKTINYSRHIFYNGICSRVPRKSFLRLLSNKSCNVISTADIVHIECHKLNIITHILQLNNISVTWNMHAKMRNKFNNKMDENPVIFSNNFGNDCWVLKCRGNGFNGNLEFNLILLQLPYEIQKVQLSTKAIVFVKGSGAIKTASWKQKMQTKNNLCFSIDGCVEWNILTMYFSKHLFPSSIHVTMKII
eukprot:5028_1